MSGDYTRRPSTADDALQSIPSDPMDFEYAGFARRLASFAVDFIIFTTLQIFLGIPILLVTDFTSAPESTVDLTLIIVCVLVGWVYFAFMESSAFQATLGKKLFRIQVVDLQGRRIGFWRATIRHFGKLFSSLFFFLGFLIIDYTKHKQGMHDMMARCLVIKTPQAHATRSE